MNNDDQLQQYIDRLRVLVMLLVTFSISLFVVVVLWVGGIVDPESPQRQIAVNQVKTEAPRWHPPDISSVKDENKRKSIEYGRALIVHTSVYLGPRGTVKHISNGLNCQNCHLDAGTKPFGNNYAAVAATYPKFRARSGQVESIEKRVNDCFERSLNGQPLDTASKEMDAIISYIKFVGSEVRAEKLPEGVGLKKIQLLDRAADGVKGKVLYEAQCSICHGKTGEGQKQPDAAEYQFPPLWGDNSYNDGAGMFRLSNLAQFIHANMPLGATSETPLLSEQDAWDIAAYVNSLPRPKKDISKDWPKIETKPFDHPFGPFADPYPEAQHKLGPFQEIQEFYSKRNK